MLPHILFAFKCLFTPTLYSQAEEDRKDEVIKHLLTQTLSDKQCLKRLLLSLSFINTYTHITLFVQRLVTLLANPTENTHTVIHFRAQVITNTHTYSGQSETAINAGKTGFDYAPSTSPSLHRHADTHTHSAGVRGVGWIACIVRLGGRVQSCDR